MTVLCVIVSIVYRGYTVLICYYSDCMYCTVYIVVYMSVCMILLYIVMIQYRGYTCTVCCVIQLLL